MPVSAWFIFTGIILVLLAIDLGLFHRKSHKVSFREALGWTVVWVILSCAFGGWVWSAHGQAKAVEFFTGYLIELSLSADNVFVFALVFNYFAVPQAYQHKVLFWGILSALVLRFIMIMAGAALIINFAWIIYVFAAFLIITAIKMLVSNDEEVHPENNPVVRWFKKAVPTTTNYEGDRFLVKRGGLWMATPLLVVLVCVEVSDVIFAVDSIPAIFAVTQDPFIVFTSNVCAILGLRSLYFVLAGVMNRFIYLKTGLALVLGFVGVKMLLSHTPYKIDSLLSLGVVALILAGSVVVSLWATRNNPPETETKSEQPLAG
jgi:tellurite resistance protein TerC